MVLWDVLCNGNVGLVGLSNVNVLVDDHKYVYVTKA